jgi:hypothetical protein
MVVQGSGPYQRDTERQTRPIYRWIIPSYQHIIERERVYAFRKLEIALESNK